MTSGVYPSKTEAREWRSSFFDYMRSAGSVELPSRAVENHRDGERYVPYKPKKDPDGELQQPTGW